MKNITSIDTNDQISEFKCEDCDSYANRYIKD